MIANKSDPGSLKTMIRRSPMNKRLVFTSLLAALVLAVAAGLAASPALAALAKLQQSTPVAVLACRTEYVRGIGQVCVSANGSYYRPGGRLGGALAVPAIEQPKPGVALPTDRQAGAWQSSRKDLSWYARAGSSYQTGMSQSD
jgi:hypothetical protein